MTVADMLFLTQRHTLLKLILQYQLVDLARLYFPDILDTDNQDCKLIKKLMMPSSYSGRISKKHGIITQKHYLTIK